MSNHSLDSLRYGRKFGSGILLGDEADGFFQQPIEQQVKALGWSHACPIVDEVVRNYGSEWAKTHSGVSQEEILQKGAESTRARYAECNFMFGLIVETARELNKPLFEALTKPIPRLEDEPIGHFEQGFIPASHLTEMSPMSTPMGYALPRVIIEQMGRGNQRDQGRTVKALELIEDAVKSSRTPIELTIKLSEGVSNLDADPRTVLYHLLSAGVLREENCKSLFQQMIVEMRRSAPMLTRVYDGMAAAEKQELGVVDFS